MEDLVDYDYDDKTSVTLSDVILKNNWNNKSFYCMFTNCGKAFRFKSEIERHSVVHLIDRPYFCSFEGCKKCFKRPDALRVHMRIHNKITPFACIAEECDKKFTTKAGLKYHLTKHSDEFIYKCTFPDCDKTFQTRGQLKQHQKTYKYHCNISSSKVQEALSNLSKGQPDNGNFDQEMAQTFKIQKEIEWEPKNFLIRNQYVETEIEKSSTPKEFKVIRNKLDLCIKRVDSFQEGLMLKENDTVFGENKISDDLDCKIIHFLSKNDKSGY